MPLNSLMALGHDMELVRSTPECVEVRSGASRDEALAASVRTPANRPEVVDQILIVRRFGGEYTAK